jgi:tetratricopeptide (TPR) repeat protein/AraC-like DNA-binding protein
MNAHQLNVNIMSFLGGNEQAFIGKLTQITLDHLEDEGFGGKELALAVGMSWSTLNRKVQAIAGKHISQFIREIRLKKALELLQGNNVTAAEVSFKVGFGSPAYFSKCFSDFYGFPPGEVKKKLAEGSLSIVEETQTAEGIPEAETSTRQLSDRFKKPQLFAAFAVLALLIIAFALTYLDRKGYFSHQAEGQETSMAVMPFQNLTKNTTRDFWEVMVQENLINSLSNVRGLKVRQTQTVNALLASNEVTNYAFLTPALSRSVSQKLDANVFVQGSISEIGDITRIHAKLIDSKTDIVFQSFQLDGNPANIIQLADSLALLVKNFLIVNLLKQELPAYFNDFFEEYAYATPIHPEAFRLYLEGMKSFAKDYPKAREMYIKALEIDPDFVPALIYLINSYGNQGLYKEAKKWCTILYEKKDYVSRIDNLLIEANYATYFRNPVEAIKYYRLLLDIDDQVAMYYYMIGLYYSVVGQYDNAIPELEKNLELRRKLGIKVSWAPNYTMLGAAYHKTGQYRKEHKLYRQAEEDIPNNPSIIRRRAILAMVRGKTKQANEYLMKFESMIRNEGASEASVQTQIGGIYEEARKLIEAEKHLREALLLEPENPIRINNLATLLIKHDIHISDGMALIDKALNLMPDHYLYLHTKGWGLYKQGNYREALEVLQRSWDLRLAHAVYNHDAFLNLEEAKKAVAKL